MTTDITQKIHAAEVVLSCQAMAETLSYFTEKLGFQVNMIFPADDPSEAVISAHGLRIRLRRDATGSPGKLRLICDDPTVFGDGEQLLTAPNGTQIELVSADQTLVLPPPQPSLVVNQLKDGSQWDAGRAGMLYRDLIPDRQGGRFIASHIRIPEGGPVPDYVHFHKIHFQMIYCYKGWVRVVYEDQGEPFVLRAGDCVLQPPEIRHRVLECSPGMEVIEIGCPAAHQTYTDHELLLPTATLKPTRDFGGQRFVRHEAEIAPWKPWRLEGFACRDMGISLATDNLASVQVARLSGNPQNHYYSHHAEFLFIFVLQGTMTLDCEGHDPQPLVADDSFVVPAGLHYRLDDCSDDIQLLEVVLPADFEIQRHNALSLEM